MAYTRGNDADTRGICHQASQELKLASSQN